MHNRTFTQRIRTCSLIMVFCAASLITGAGAANANSTSPRDSVIPTGRKAAVLYFEDFESGGGDWTVIGGLWAVDHLTSGPGAAHSGEFAAATNPHGGYSYYQDARIVSPEVALPAGEIWLRFWHASHLGGRDGDRGRVQVSCNGGPWETLPHSEVRGHGANVWGQAFYDLSSYAGCTVQIAFWFTSDNTAGSSGWHIDDVGIEEGAANFPATEDFEDGFGDFCVTSGLWEVGTPSVGPSGAHSGNQCVGTILSGAYPYYSYSRLLTPPKQLPASPLDGKLWLRFWHASGMGGRDADRGAVQVSCNGGPWETLPHSEVRGHGANVWGQAFYDLSAYAGCTVQIAFYFTSDNTAGGSGWFIDDVSIEEGAANFPATEDFEDGFGDFCVTSGLWEVGTPSVGPPGAHSGSQCVGTILSGAYPYYSYSRLVTPPKELPVSPLDGKIWLRFWHASDMGNQRGDFGNVQISCDQGPWETLPFAQVGDRGGNVWGQALYDLSAYAGCTVQIAFYFTSDNTAGGTGWFIDDVGIEEGQLSINSPENFDAGDPATPQLWWQGDPNWTATSGIWEVGEPLSGPGSAHSGSFCVGTILGGAYPIYASSRFVTPEFELSPSPLGGGIWLHFWQAHDLVSGDIWDGGDTGRIQISCDGGDWVNLPNSDVTMHGANVWGLKLHDLSAHAGCSVRVAFWFQSDHSPGPPGWYIDDLGIQEGQPTFRGSTEGFETGTGGWSTSNGLWEIGVPASGPGAAYEGSLCAATVLDGNYPRIANARLLTPPIRVSPLNPLEPVLFQFMHWYSLSDDQGIVEISVDEGEWTATDMIFTGSGGGNWNESPPYDLSIYSGSTIQLSFRLSSGNANQSSGWYIDAAEFTNLDMNPPTSPQNLRVEYYSQASILPGETITHPMLSWDPVEDSDLTYYAIYRGEGEDFIPDFGSRIALVTSTEYVDLGSHGSHYDYKVSSVDNLWNEGVPMEPAQVVAVPNAGEQESPQTIVLSVNYPNPFNPITTISFGLPSDQHVKLVIYDLRGREVATLADEVLTAGYHSRTLDAEGMPSGIYIYRLETGDGNVAKKMVLLK